MNFSSKLVLLEKKGVYPAANRVATRWGQLLRQSPDLAAWLAEAEGDGRLVRLGDLGRVRSGAVTRANAYFLVAEVPFEKIPKRFRLTRGDLARVTVVEDGLGTLHKIERPFLRRVVKGPESLLTMREAESGDELLFHVNVSRDELRRTRASGALDYLRRGETVAYKTSEDSLKGGIPAARAQVKNRKPFWYSIGVATYDGPRILLPEHIDERYITTLLDQGDERIVIDTLYTLELFDPDHAELMLAGLNSLLTWYQLELRGRTQHGEGVLKVKIPDWSGILVLNPERVTDAVERRLLSAFSKIATQRVTNSLNSVSEPTRVTFDTHLLELAGAEHPSELRLELERETRAAASERHERKASVAEAKRGRQQAGRTPLSIDAYAARIAAALAPYPDPRTFVHDAVPVWRVEIAGPSEGPVTVGRELFNQGQVFAGDRCVTAAHDVLSAEFVAAAILSDRSADFVEVPADPYLRGVMEEWKAETVEWERKFAQAAIENTRAVTDPRVRQQIVDLAMLTLHAR